ncbi:MAG: TetR/AcrR family transcriptional regulator [Deltaproteobacteria bacterium]|nr:TetR/AcrR family transcriptional regulator [Deltaproteobacteria bacterium]
MPKAPRTPEEVELVRQAILDAALKIIVEEGYKGFSMRKLGKSMGMTAKTVYNYFINKDEIYLRVLTTGFELLHVELLSSYQAHDDPWQKLQSMARAYVEFGTGRPNYYDIMLTWYVPKYNDFMKTDLEPMAAAELKAARGNSILFIKTIIELGSRYGHLDPANARQDFIELFVGLHGTVSLYNNTILSYVHDHPEEILATLISSLVARFEPKQMTDEVE